MDQSRDEKTARARRKKLTKQEIRDLELAGGAEGGMQAGSAGGPGESDSTSERCPDTHNDQS